MSSYVHIKCGRQVYRNGLCSRHYKQGQVLGEPVIAVRPAGGCVDTNGYMSTGSSMRADRGL